MSNPKLSPNQPWLHGASGIYVKKIAGKLYYLDRSEQVAKRKLAKILRDRNRVKGGNRDWLNAPFAELCDAFLDAKCKSRRWKPGTYQDYRYRLRRALRIIGAEVRVAEVNTQHVEDIEGGLADKELSPTTIRDTISAVQSVFRWAISREIVVHDPVKGYEKPEPRERSRVVTPREFQMLLGASACNRPFQRVLIVLRSIGCRPGELRNLTWEMVDFEQRCWIIPDHKTVKKRKKRRPRIIALPDCIWKMCQWLKDRSDRHETHVFVNAWGRPYTKDRLVKTMVRVRKRAGIELKAGEQIVLYSHRHEYGTSAYGKVGDIALAELMGHIDIRTTRRYIHFDVPRLHESQRLIQAKR